MRPPVALTPHQTAAISAHGDRILLVASAGSGKTEVLTRRVMRHLNESPGDTFRVLAVTFTVRAAGELRDRIRDSVSSEAWRVDANTIHGFAFDWLLRFGQQVGIYSDTFVFAEDADRLGLLDEYIQSLGEGTTPEADLRACLAAIDRVRTVNPSLNEAGLNALPGVGSIAFKDLLDGYLAAMESLGGIDFPAMLAKFLEAANLDQRFLTNFHNTYRHVLVDEGQDLSAAQSAVLSTLVRPPVDLFVVADERQSINGFAGGGFANVVTLVGDAATASALRLPHNFRCARTVLQAAESLAAHLQTRPAAVAQVEGAPPGLVAAQMAASPAAEAELVTGMIGRLLANGLQDSWIAEGEDGSVVPEDVAVVARSRWLLQPTIDALQASGIEVAVQTDTQDFLQSPEARLFAQGVSLQGIRNPPAERKILDELRGMGHAIDDASPFTIDSLRTLGDTKVSEIADALTGITTRNLAERLRALKTSAGAGVAEDFAVLESEWAAYCVAVIEQGRDLAGFSRHLARVRQTRPSDPGVRLLTIHKVKGLEFKSVFVIGAHEGAIPDYRAKTALQIDEERRSFYVAVTRASRSLVVSFPAATVDRYGRAHEQQASRFVAECGLQVQS